MIPNSPNILFGVLSIVDKALAAVSALQEAQSSTTTLSNLPAI